MNRRLLLAGALGMAASAPGAAFACAVAGANTQFVFPGPGPEGWPAGTTVLKISTDQPWPGTMQDHEHERRVRVLAVAQGSYRGDTVRLRLPNKDVCGEYQRAREGFVIGTLSGGVLTPTVTRISRPF